MKIKEIIKESNEDIIKKLRNNCSQTIELMKKSNEAIYHGIHNSYPDIEKIKPLKHRMPRDMPKPIHYSINDYLNEKEIKTNRSNSIFGLKEINKDYGDKIFVLFPVNNANISWFEQSEDLYISLRKYLEKKYKKNLDQITKNEIDKNDFKQFLDTLEPNTSLEEYFYNKNSKIEILISSPVYVVKNKIFETTNFKEQIGLL